MNKLVIINDTIDKKEINELVDIEIVSKRELFAITTINIIVNGSTKLKIDYKSTMDTKLNINIKLEPNSILDLYEYKIGNYYKTKYQYTLDKSSKAIVNKFYYLDNTKEYTDIRLNGPKAIIEYNFRSIAKGEEKYDLLVHHNAKETTSIIKNNGLCLDNGSIIYDVSSFVSKKISNCVLKQSNRIVNLNDNKSQINPNMYIDNNDIEATHSALIGKFKDDEIFYLMSRGINKKDAIKLLIKGFILGNIKDKRIENIINKI